MKEKWIKLHIPGFGARSGSTSGCLSGRIVKSLTSVRVRVEVMMGSPSISKRLVSFEELLSRRLYALLNHLPQGLDPARERKRDVYLNIPIRSFEKMTSLTDR